MRGFGGRHRQRGTLDAERAPPDEYHDLLERAAADRVKRALTGNSDLADRNDILLPDRQSAELGAAARRDNPAAVTQVPLEFIDDTLCFNPEWVVDRIAPRPILFITTDDDRLVPPSNACARQRAQEARGAEGLWPLRDLWR